MEKLFGFVERVSKVVLAISVAGYLSLRAHFNFLGVSSLTALTLERYLLETYLFVMGSLQRALSIMPVVIIVGGIGWGLYRLIARRRPISVSSTSWRLALLCLLLISVLLAYFMQASTDVVVGNLKNKSFLRQEWLVDLLIFTLLLGAISLVWGDVPGGRDQNQVQRWEWINKLNQVLLCVVALLLPLRFGEQLHSRDYPIASLKLKGSEIRQCGLLLYQSAERLVMWQAANGFGRIHNFETKSVHELMTGEVKDIVKMASEAAKKEPIVPDCQMLGG